MTRRRPLTAAPPDELTVGDDSKTLRDKADAMGVLIRSGVKPDSAARQVGLSGLDFWDGRPITLRYEDEE